MNFDNYTISADTITAIENRDHKLEQIKAELRNCPNWHTKFDFMLANLIDDIKNSDIFSGVCRYEHINGNYVEITL